MMLHHSHTKENEILITIITLEKDWFRVTRLIISQPFNHAKNKCCLIITYYIVPLKQLPGGIILQTVGEGDVTVVDGVSFMATDVGISLGGQRQRVRDSWETSASLSYLLREPASQPASDPAGVT